MHTLSDQLGRYSGYFCIQFCKYFEEDQSVLRTPYFPLVDLKGCSPTLAQVVDGFFLADCVVLIGSIGCGY